MKLILQPKFSPSNKVRVWVGAFNRTHSPSLKWEIRPASSNTPVPGQLPFAIKTMRSVRPPALLNGNPKRTFSGIYEFLDCLPDSVYYVKVKDEENNSFELRVKTLPVDIPSYRHFNILLVSCYCSENDKSGIVDNLTMRIPNEYKPDITFLMGDQVYLDIPTFKDFPNDPKWMSEKFENDYERNWRGIDRDNLSGYSKILSMAPSISTADDHEFWNNYPHVSPFIGNSHTSAGRDNWKKAALAAYEGFQTYDDSEPGGSTVFDVPPVSFFISDTRVNRDFNLNYIFTDEEITKLSSWLNRLNSENLFGMIVSGQSFFQNKPNSFQGSIGDYEFPNYNDYRTLTELFKNAAEKGTQITFLTGDVHYGRIGYLKRIYKQSFDFVEIISSPASLVTSPWDFVSEIFGKEPWPKHSKGERLEELKVTEFNMYQRYTRHRQVGDHMAILSLKRSGFGLDRTITYFPTHWNRDVYNNYFKSITLPKLI